MSIYHICSDKINGKERSYINQAVEQIKTHGLKAEAGAVGPNTLPSYGLTSVAADKIGVLIVGGRPGETHIDYHKMCEKGTYRFVQMYILGAYEFTHNKWLNPSMMNVPFGGPEPGSNGAYTSDYVGKTPVQLNNEFPRCQTIIANTLHEAVELMLNGTTPTNESNPEPVSYKDMLKDLLKPLDGYVEIYVRDDECYVHQIPFAEPDFDDYEENKENGYTYYPPKSLIYASEGINIVHDSLSFTDHNPGTYNKLIVSYTDKKTGDLKTLTMENSSLIHRFGEHEKEMDAVIYVEGTYRESDKSDVAKLKTLAEARKINTANEERIVRDRHSRFTKRTGHSGNLVKIKELEEENKQLEKDINRNHFDFIKDPIRKQINKNKRTIDKLKKENAEIERKKDLDYL